MRCASLLVGIVGAAELVAGAACTEEPDPGQGPDGELRFSTTQPSIGGDSGVPAYAAAGGDLTYTMHPYGTDEVPSSYRIVFADPTFTADAPDGPSFRVHAPDHAATSELDVAPIGGPGRYGRGYAGALAIDHVELVPFDDQFFPDASPPRVLLAHRPVRVIVRLKSTTGIDLVDEGLAVASDGVSAQTTIERWDALITTADAAGALTAHASNRAFQGDAAVPVVDAVEQVIARPGTLNVVPNPQAGDTVTSCFEALSGTARIVGVAWTFQVDAPGELAPVTGYPSNCVGARRASGGPLTVRATAGGIEAVDTIDIAP